MSTKKVYLRPITSADTDKIVSWRNQDFVRKNFIYQEPFTKAGHETWLREQVKPGHVAQFIICVGPENVCLPEGGIMTDREAAVGGDMKHPAGAVRSHREIGSVYLRDIDRKMGKAEYGIFIGERDALGKGYGTQAAKWMLHYGFETIRLKKIFLRLLEDNSRAQKSYEKAGFRLIKNKRGTVTLQQGECVVLFMEIDRRRWEAMKEKN